MVSKNQIKLITALRQKKFRDEYQMFFAEGAKVIAELHWRKQDNFQWLEIVAIPQFSWQNAMPVGLPPKAGAASSGGR